MYCPTFVCILFIFMLLKLSVCILSVEGGGSLAKLPWAISQLAPCSELQGREPQPLEVRSEAHASCGVHLLGHKWPDRDSGAGQIVVCNLWGFCNTEEKKKENYFHLHNLGNTLDGNKKKRKEGQLPCLPYLKFVVTDDGQLLCPLAKALFPQQEVSNAAVLVWTHRTLLWRPLPGPLLTLGLIILFIVGFVGAAQCIWIIIWKTCKEC